MAASIRYEIERLKRRGHRNIDHGASMSMSPTPSEGSNSDSEGMPMSPDPPHIDGSSNHINNNKKEALFTYKQVMSFVTQYYVVIEMFLFQHLIFFYLKFPNPVVFLNS